MRLDVRLPIGGLFSLLGALLTAYGAATRSRPGSAPTGVPIDLVWGVVLLAFGVWMLFLARRAAGRNPPPPPSPQTFGPPPASHR